MEAMIVNLNRTMATVLCPWEMRLKIVSLTCCKNTFPGDIGNLNTNMFYA